MSISPTTPLPTRRLGDSELEVSLVGLGCNNFGRRLDLEGTAAVLEAALAAGITLFDTADIYGDGASERLIGDALAGRRDEYVLATKFGMEINGAEGEGVPDAARGSREYIRWAVEAHCGGSGSSGSTSTSTTSPTGRRRCPRRSRPSTSWSAKAS